MLPTLTPVALVRQRAPIALRMASQLASPMIAKLPAANTAHAAISAPLSIFSIRSGGRRIPAATSPMTSPLALPRLGASVPGRRAVIWRSLVRRNSRLHVMEKTSVSQDRL